MLHRPIRGKTGVHPLRSFLALAALLTACGHQDAFTNGEVPDVGPPSVTPPYQITFAQGEDLDPVWLADGSGLAYSFRREGGLRTDRCLAILPPGGGTRQVEKCTQGGDAADSLRALGPVGPGSGSQAVWVDFRNVTGRKAPDVGSIRIGTLGAQDTGQTIRTLPYPAPSGQLHATATNFSWLAANLVAYIGSDVFYVAPCRGCKVDTVVSPREAVIADLSTTPATLQTIPNTSQITSLFPSADGLSIYYTRPGDSKVYQQILSTGAESIIHDFGALGIVRDVNVRGSTLTATVGGIIDFRIDSLLGPRQVDSGGFGYVVNLATGAEEQLPFSRSLLFRHPALSPDAKTLVIEAIDTFVPPPRIDLWLYRLP